MTARVFSAALFGLCLSVWALPAAAQDENPWANCEICREVMKETDLLAACDYNVADWSEGAIFTLLVKDPAVMTKFRKFEETDKAMTAEFLAMSAAERKGRLCPHCEQYLLFRDRGLEEERIPTSSGTVIMTRTNDPALLKDLHAWAAEVREQLASFDMSALGEDSKEKCGCGGTCATCAGKKPACDCGGEPCTCKEQTAAQIPDFMLKEMEKCYLCQTYLKDPSMMFAAKPDVIKLKTGMVIVSTINDLSQLEKFHAFEQSFHDKIEQLMDTGDFDAAKAKVCTFCGEFCDLAHEGALMEWSNTDTGSVSLFVSDKPELVKKIHAVAAQLEAFGEMMPQEQPK